MKRIISLLLVITLATTLLFCACTSPEEPESEEAQEPVESVESSDLPEDVGEEEPIEDGEHEPPSEEVVEIGEEEQKIITEPLKLHLDRDLTEEDINDLKNYSKIELWIEAEGVNISLLSELENLESLELYQGHYPGLLGDWYFYYISDFSFLNDMNLTTLKLDCSGFDINLNEINLENLENLELYYANIIDEEEIKTFPNLKNLTIWFSDINSIDPFCGMELEYIYFYVNSFNNQNFDNINKIKTLKKLIIGLCGKIQFTAFNGLINLELLSIYNNEINFDIEIIYELTWLEILQIDHPHFLDEQKRKFSEINPECLIGEVIAYT